MKKILLFISIMMVSVTLFAQNGAQLKSQIENAKPGETVIIPAGTYDIDEIIVPSGVSIKGEGYSRVILNAKDDNGLKIVNSDKAFITGFTIVGAKQHGILLENCTSSTIARVIAKNCVFGIKMVGGQNNRIAVSSVVENRTGIMVANEVKSSVSNCTIYNSKTFGMSVDNTTDSAFFNNLFTGNSMGIYLAQNSKNIEMDYNLYWGAVIGKGFDSGIRTIGMWRTFEHLDYHSIDSYIEMDNAVNGDYTVTNTQNWRPYTIPYGAGIASIGESSAVATDINDKPFKAASIGAYSDAREINFAEADGKFIVHGSDVYATLGLYDDEGRLKCWLFSMLPLKPGTYEYWVPATDMFGNRIPAGKYTAKLTEGNLKIDIADVGGNSTIDPFDKDSYAALGVDKVLFDSKERPLLVLNWSESYQQIRGMNDDLTRQRWSIPGASDTIGAAIDGKGIIYLFKHQNNDYYLIQRIDEEKGVILEDAPGQYGVQVPREGLYDPETNWSDPRGLCYFNGKVYTAVTYGNKLVNVYDLNDMYNTLAYPILPVTDEKHNLIWYISESKTIVAMNEDGVNEVTFTPSYTGIASIAVNGDRMIVVSCHLGQVVLYDISDYKNPRELRRIGTGDGPFGKIQINRFEFQSAAPNGTINRGWSALKSDGTMLIVDIAGPKMFNWEGEGIRDFSGVWAQYMVYAGKIPGTNIHEVIDYNSNKSVVFNDVTKKAEWGIKYSNPEFSDGIRYTTPNAYFYVNGVRYGYLAGERLNENKQVIGFIIVLSKWDDKGKGTAVWALSNFENKWHERNDFSNGGINNIEDWTVITKADGTNIMGMVFSSGIFPTDSPNLTAATDNRICEISCLSFDNGVPTFDWDNIKEIRNNNESDDSKVLSPYDLKSRENAGFNRLGSAFDDDTYVALNKFNSANSAGFSNSSGTTFTAYDKNGKIKWMQPLTVQDPQNLKVVGNLGYSVPCPLQEFEVITKDGALIGVLGTPRGLFWHGLWVDNSNQYTAFSGADGTHYTVFGNFNDSAMWFCEVSGAQDVTSYDFDIILSDAWYNKWRTNIQPRTDVLWHRAPNDTSNVIIKRLEEPLTMNGDLSKWRNILPNPQIIITPESGPNINGPKDSSAILRFAYIQDKDNLGDPERDENTGLLFVQLIRFDNIVTIHQPYNKFYQQDCIEMSINGYLEGVKFNSSISSDRGALVVRDGWFFAQIFLSEEDAPRNITVYDDATLITERKILEDIYNIDMSDCKVTVTEFVAPLNPSMFDTNQRRPNMPKVRSGESFYLGIAIDENDWPGADYQKMFCWPPTYNTFADKDVSGLVTFE